MTDLAVVHPPRFSFEKGVPESATITARTLAFAIDLVLLFVVNLVIGAFLVGSGLVPAPDPGRTALDAASDPFVLVLALIEAPLSLGYFVVTEALWGRGVGKLALGLRVVDAGGGRPTWGQSTMRNLMRFLWFVPFLSVAFVLVDWYLMKVGEMDQRIGDLAAKTFVVKDGVTWPPTT